MPRPHVPTPIDPDVRLCQCPGRRKTQFKFWVAKIPKVGEPGQPHFRTLKPANELARTLRWTREANGEKAWWQK